MALPADEIYKVELVQVPGYPSPDQAASFLEETLNTWRVQGYTVVSVTGGPGGTFLVVLHGKPPAK